MFRKIIPLAFFGLVLALIAMGCASLLDVDFGAAHLQAVDASVAACVPKTCTDLGDNCDVQDDGCGGTVDCGTCNAKSKCKSGKCDCIGKTCPELKVTCGTTDDGCGRSLDCGGCTGANETCVAGSCACQPKSCTVQGAQCGDIPDGCGNSYNCDTPGCAADAGAQQYCGAGNKCVTQQCIPKTQCDPGQCGKVSDGCGKLIACAACPSPETCGGSGTPNQCGCTPTTCAKAGASCGTIDDGCGNKLNCGNSCMSPETCGGGANGANQCGCSPTIKACPAGSCGVMDDGCGNTIACSTICSSGQTCTGNVCTCGNCTVLNSLLQLQTLCCPIGGGGCLVAGSPITMADGSTRSIETLHRGDVVLSSENGVLASARVVDLIVHDPSVSDAGIVVINGHIRATTNHPFAVHGDRVRAEELKVGDELTAVYTDSAGVLRTRIEPILTVSREPGHVTSYDLRVGGSGTYFGGGYSMLQKVQQF